MTPLLHVAGHFGEYLQGRLGPGGPVVLVTLPCAALGVQAWQGADGSRLRLAGAGWPRHALRPFLRDLGCRLSGKVRLRAMVPAGLGTGVSTARLVALARLGGYAGGPDALARACLRLEGASDPLMYAAPARLLWASRVGLALDHLPPLPPHEVIGGFWGRPERTDATDQTFPDIADLVAAWPCAGGLAGFAALASESARRTQALRGPQGDPTPALARALGALGWVRAHTGAARGLIFAPGQTPVGARAVLRAAGMRHILHFRAREAGA